MIAIRKIPIDCLLFPNSHRLSAIPKFPTRKIYDLSEHFSKVATHQNLSQGCWARKDLRPVGHQNPNQKCPPGSGSRKDNPGAIIGNILFWVSFNESWNKNWNSPSVKQIKVMLISAVMTIKPNTKDSPLIQGLRWPWTPNFLPRARRCLSVRAQPATCFQGVHIDRGWVGGMSLMFFKQVFYCTC